MPPVIVIVNLMYELLVHPEWLLISESLGCLDAVHKIVPPCLSPLKVVQSHPLAHDLHHIVRFIHTHHLERQSINWCLKHLTMIHIPVLKMCINRSTRYTFGPIIFLLGKLCSIHTLPFQVLMQHLCEQLSWTIGSKPRNSYCGPWYNQYISPV